MVSTSNPLEILEKEYINSIYLSSLKDFVVFETNRFFIAFSTMADCCSESWINHISGLECLSNTIVIKTEAVTQMKKLEKGDEGFSGKQEVDEIYSFKIFTPDGVCELEMRNASNGYYGGWLELHSLKRKDNEEVDISDIKLVQSNF
jgi:hypothetical protein